MIVISKINKKKVSKKLLTVCHLETQLAPGDKNLPEGLICRSGWLLYRISKLIQSGQVAMAVLHCANLKLLNFYSFARDLEHENIVWLV